MNLYSIFDGKARKYVRHFTSVSDGTAAREFEHAATEETGFITHWKEDFSLWRLAEIDERDGSMVAEPQLIVEAIAYERFEPTEKEIDA